MPPKRTLSNAALSPAKRPKIKDGTNGHVHDRVPDMYNKIATLENSNRARENPPVAALQEVIREAKRQRVVTGSSIVYWMRMQDMRIEDNRAISAASLLAQKHGIPLVTLFIISPQDYAAHDRGARRIDFMLRNLDVLKDKLDKLDIPFYVISHTPRRTLPQRVIQLMEDWGAKTLCANLEYEIDEARRDLKVLDLAKEKRFYCDFHEDKLVVPPFTLSTLQGKQYAVYSPWLRAWKTYLDGHPECFKESPAIKGNLPSIRQDPILSPLFEITIPNAVPGSELSEEGLAKMEELWPAGIDVAREVLHRFLTTKFRIELLDASPLKKGALTISKNGTRMGRYSKDRDFADRDSSSRISPYLSSGVISIRELIRETMKFEGRSKVNVDRESGPGTWVSELGWRDFYSHVLAAYPHVSMGRPFQEKYADIKWETDQAKFDAWKDGMTGYPIVDAAMRQLKIHGWMHNRTRMIVAMFLTKDLMMDWRLGEKWFMNQLIDGDLANNNGGWQWSASTGVDPQPYFRVFNPTLQSEKADPDGELIRHFVPELKHVKGNAIHEPSKRLIPAEFKKLGYPAPIVDHKEAKDRAIRRYQTPGSL